MNDFVKSKIKRKNQLYKIYTKNGYKYNDYLKLKETTVLVSQVIAKRKEDYHIHKKGDKQTSNNYRPVSLLSICGKVFERQIFNSLFEYLEKYKLLLPHQSGFRASDSCVDQLLSIVHNIYTAFDEYPTLESRGVF